MKLGDIEYLKLVDKLMGHKLTLLTESECAQEVASIQDGAVSSFAESDVQDRTVNEVQPIPSGGYITKSGRVYKNKPGRRPKG